MQSLISFMDGGLLDLSLTTLAIVFFTATFLTVLSVTVYLHRCMAHRGVDLHPLVTHPMRFWLWLTTGMVTKDWVAIHRKHHARCETDEDPHSPRTHGIAKVLFHGVALYQDAAKDKAMIEQYGHGSPNDWIDRNIYQAGYAWGPTTMAVIDLALFGVHGITFWALQMIWIPFFAAGVINGLGHWWGYRNFSTDDLSTNLTPWGIVLGGEELHNNHHAFPSSARFSMKPWEFDIGWQVIRLLSVLGLAEVRRVAPRLVRDRTAAVDRETLRAVFAHRFTVMSDYYRDVVTPLVREEATRLRAAVGTGRGQLRQLLAGDQRYFDPVKRRDLGEILSRSRALATVYEYRERLQALWDRSTTDPDALLAGLREWCREAEASGIDALRQFARSVAAYRLAPA